MNNNNIIYNKFFCVRCNTLCTRKSEFDRHIKTRKHKHNLESTVENVVENIVEKIVENVVENVVVDSTSCICGAIFKTRCGLWKHSKKCNNNNNNNEVVNGTSNNNNNNNNTDLLKQLVLEVVKNNAELQQVNSNIKQLINVCQTIGATTNINNTFNLHIFLNEKCKNAMNITDFVDTFKLKLADLEHVGIVGYVDGISEMIIQKLSEIDVYKRPIHCIDVKRETLIIKENNTWEKDNDRKDKFRTTIKQIAKKNSDMIPTWGITHPFSRNSEHELNEVYMSLVMQAMGGRGDVNDNETKIIKKISKTILINKAPTNELPSNCIITAQLV